MKLNKISSLRLFLAFVIIGIILYTGNRASQQFREGDELTEYLHSISGNDILEIQAFLDAHFSEPLLDIDINSLDSRNIFATGLRCLEYYHPGHDTHIEEGSISFKLKNKGEFFIYFWIKPKNKNTVCMYLMKRTGTNSYCNLGGRKSKKLYEWLNFINFMKFKHSNQGASRASQGSDLKTQNNS